MATSDDKIGKQYFYILAECRTV